MVTLPITGDVVKTTADEQNVLLISLQCVPYIVHGEIIAVIQMIIVSKIKGVSDFVMIHVCVDTTLYLLKFNLMSSGSPKLIYQMLFLCISVNSCPWSAPTSQDNVLQCNGGAYCNGIYDGWDCCNSRGMRAKCPLNYPTMCAQPDCAWGDYCCYTEDVCAASYGGVRSCDTHPFQNEGM